MRLGPGKEYAVSFTLQKGDEVELLSVIGVWYEIKHLGNTGYVHSKFLVYSRTTGRTQVAESQKTVSNVLIASYVSLALYVSFLVYRRMVDRKLLKSVTELNRGTRTERHLVFTLLKSGIPSQYIFHDLYVEKREGTFSQIDLVLVTDVGIIVFEVKDYGGWIFGRGNESQWTQVMAYGRQKYRFYNPIRQNVNHIAVLKRKLVQFGEIPFYSVVVFYGKSVFKQIEFVPDGTFLIKPRRVLEVLSIIMRDNALVQYSNKDEVLRILGEVATNGALIDNRAQHTENITNMQGKDRILD